jgi:predicted RNA-binding protein (virulence factor B family)
VITTDKPFAMVDDIVGLKVVNANKIGAFLDWGMKKDLFVPSREQNKPMQVGHVYLVHLMLDTKGAWSAPAAWSASCASTPLQGGDEVTVLPGAHPSASRPWSMASTPACCSRTRCSAA